MKDTKIEWTDHTFNPWEGCTKVSPGCANCYAEARNKRWNAGANWGKGALRRRTSEANWKQPVKWDKEASLINESKVGRLIQHRPRVFCASLADWLDDEVPIEWLADLLKLIYATRGLDWLLLTKRPQNWKQRICEAAHHIKVDYWVYEWLGGKAPSNVWIGTTVEDQQRADERIPELLKIPARVRFLSCEPLLETVDLPSAIEKGLFWKPDGNNNAWSVPGAPLINWVIFGGESNGRACNIDWIYDGVQQCQRAGVKCFVKQLGSNAHTGNANLYDWPDSTELVASCCIEGAAAAGIRTRDRKGGNWDEWPEQLRVREVPS